MLVNCRVVYKNNSSSFLLALADFLLLELQLELQL